jgi:PIN domain nuclease of toxin-antitoxin system
MTSVLLDASALIAMMLRERGGDVVARHLEGAAVSTVNLSEVYGKSFRWNLPLATTIEQVKGLPISVVPFLEDDAVVAASLVPVAKPLGLSFADRACLAVGMNRGLTVLTGDRRWKDAGIDVKLKFFR